ncbi:MAG TPA: DUF6541 family protein [Candidatus Saccharimonadales bacterium]|nr:DUF6541 family protein [Candidatus Saccharimonadales bacterium]
MVFSLLKLILTIPFVLVLPGVFFQLAIFGWKSAFGGGKISFFEKAVLAVPFSLIIVDLIVLLLNKMNILLKGPVLVGAILIFCLVCFAFFQFRFGNRLLVDPPERRRTEEGDKQSLFNFSTWQTIFILLAIVLAIFIRTAYLSDTVIPSATDLGHHMYWVQTIINTGHLPDYGVPDFIIGEHMIFAVVNLISGVKITTAMPVLLLLLFNITGIFTIAILLGRVFENNKIVAMSFFVAGSLYAINPPQGRYVSGGVVGNVIGDMLIPVAMYFFYRVLKERDQIFAGLFIFSFAGLLYTHHLSAFVLIFSIAAVVILYLILNFRNGFKIISEWTKLFLKPFPLALIFIFALYFLLIFTPSYFNPAAVGQATGEPTKNTRIGFGIAQIDSGVGSALLVLGAAGFLILMLELFKEKILSARGGSAFGGKHAFAIGWFLVLFTMTWKPGLLYVNIPSDRVSNYLFLPLVFLSSYALVRYFEVFTSATSRFFSTIFLFMLLFFVITNGLSDSADVFKTKNQFQGIMETFHSAAYLAATVDTNKDIILKDHVNIYGDSWYKLFFMKDYKYPLSRGVLMRYVDPTKPRETCTRDMISDPESDSGKACFVDTGVNYVVVNAQIEGNSFEKYPDFSKVYGSDYISIFRRD